MDVRFYGVRELPDEKLMKLLRDHESFVIEKVPRKHFGEVIKTLEKHIDSLGMKCRVFAKGRKSLMAGSFFGPTAIWGVASVAFMGAHNVATWDPDYEIAKNRVTGTLTVTYKKKDD
ncbi:MAG: hypothetical protein HLX50_14145 [Alteromonadaceae bacterium]|nr:hypothetical protein [Alteromonadaceae bacterium]